MSGHVLRFPPRDPSPSPTGLELYKLDPPPLPPGISAASAAVEALEAHVEGPVTLLEAGAGAGKTTLLSSWFASTTQPAGWLTVEPEDEDPLRFAAHVVAAVHRAQPDLIAELDGLRTLPESAEIEVLWAEHFVCALRQSGARVVLVLDDLHHVLESDRCVAALAWLAGCMPSGLSLVCSSERPVHLTPGEVRHRPRLPMYRAGSETPPAIRLYGLKFEADVVRDLEVVHPFGPSGVVEPISTEDLDLPGIEDFDPACLAPLAVPRRLTAALVDRLLDTDDGAARLRALAEAGIGVLPQDNRHQWYRLSPELREVQLSLLSSAELEQAHARAASWCLEHGLSTRAVDHLAAAGASALEGVDPVAWGERLLERRAFGAVERFVGLWPDAAEVARYDAWRQLFCGAPLLARATLRSAAQEADADLAAASALAAFECARTDEAADRVTDPPEAEPGTRAAAVLDYVAGRLLEGSERDKAVEHLRAAAEHARQARLDTLAIEAARREIDVLVGGGLLDDAQVRLREAEAWVAEAHLFDSTFDASLGCARAGLSLAKKRWSDTVASAGRALDVLDPLPAARDRRLLVSLVQTALQKLPAKETADPVLCVVQSGEGHRSFARALGVSVAQVKLTVQDALEPHGVERWWQYLMG